jgi:Alpha/beta hydrolase domain
MTMKPSLSRGPAVRSHKAVGAVLSTVLAATLVSLTGYAPAEAARQNSESSKAQTMPAAILKEVNVPGTTPMSAAAVDLAALGYTEREFYAEGKANRYSGADSTSLQTAQVIDGNRPYNTRVLVRTPDARHFNGTLVVEWLNVTLGLDGEFVFNEAHEHLLRAGYAVAAVSAQRAGVERLKTWSPERYGALSVDVNACGSDGGSLCSGDPLSFDIMTQVAKALKDNMGDSKPLPGLDVDNVIATGQSQSAIRLTTYYNTIQPLYNFFDGFVYWDRSDQLRSDQAVPAISVNSEALAPTWRPVTTSKYTRAWDVAGATHASLYGAQYIDDVVLRDKSIVGPNGPMSFTSLVAPSCKLLPVFSTVDSGLVVNAAFESVRDWITKGKEAAPSRYFDRDAEGNLLRDSTGKVQGGIRLAQFTAPTAFNAANNGTAFPCSISGHHRDHTADELKDLYGSHQNYVKQVRDTMKQAEKDGYLLKFDEKAAVRAAENSDVAR